LCLFSFDLAEMAFLRIWISARRVFAWGGICLFVSRVVFGCGRGGLAGMCVMGMEVGGREDARGCYCMTDPTSLHAMSARTWGERFLVLSRIFLRVWRNEEALRSRSSWSDFCILPYFSFQEW